MPEQSGASVAALFGEGTPERRLLDAACDTFMALDEFDNETVLSLARPGRLRDWKERFFDLRVELEEAHDNAR